MADLKEKLVVYNTLTRQKEPFRPQNEGKVSMYVCGVTVYDSCHLGHARAYVSFDVVRRCLEWLGFEVNYVQNFTDVDDKIINRAKEIGQPIDAITTKYIGEYYDVMDRLGIKRASLYPRATEHLQEMQDMISRLIGGGHAYEKDGNVFFAVDTFKDYGKLGRINRDDMVEQERGAWEGAKRNQADFALWKKAKEGEPSWDSPWGKGRPGWHIECSAMSCKYLGETFDIHGGGQDLIFPHHENELAQSRCSTDGNFANYWIHNGFVKIDAEKMAKSLGNFKTIKDLLKIYEPDTLRLFLLSAHYRQPIDFTESGMKEAKSAYERFTNFLNTLGNLGALEAAVGDAPEALKSASDSLGAQIEKTKANFAEAVCDDFNSQEALASLFDLVRESNTFIKAYREAPKEAQAEPCALSPLAAARETLLELGSVLGLFQNLENQAAAAGLEDDLMRLLLDLRQAARKNKDWTTADTIRDRLNELEIVIEDTPEGAVWRRKS